MPQEVSLVRIMIASPSDVAHERQQIRNVIADWNTIHAIDRSMVLYPMGWETHSSPEMGDRPQAVISKQILVDADLLVAVFWTKIGSPTGLAASGTVEEIEEHVAAGKPAMIYFSSAPVDMRSVDQGQYEAMLEFKKKCQSTGLFQEYDSIGAFKDLFARHLAQTIIRKFKAATDPDEVKRARQSRVELSPDAEHLLQEAAAMESGSVMRIETLGGTMIETDRVQFLTEQSSAKEVARWDAALNALVEKGLIEDRTGKGELFWVTHSGYSVADYMGPYEPEPEQTD